MRVRELFSLPATIIRSVKTSGCQTISYMDYVHNYNGTLGFQYVTTHYVEVQYHSI